MNVLSRKVHAMWVSRHVQTMGEWVDQALERSREEFNRYRDIALGVEGGRLTKTLLNELDGTCVVPQCRSAGVMHLRQSSRLQSSTSRSYLQLMCGVDQRMPTRNGPCRPFQCVIGNSISEQLLGLQSLRMSRDNLCSNLQCVEDFQLKYVLYLM